MRVQVRLIFLWIFLLTQIATPAIASTCREKLSDDSVLKVTGFTPEQLELIDRGAGSFSSLEEIMAQGIPEHSVLLGPTGRLYNALVQRYNLYDFWSAYREVSMNPNREQTDDYVKLFLQKLAKQKRFSVYFLIPERYESTNMTKSEIKILFENPELMANFHFIYTPQTNFKIIELGLPETQSRPRQFIQMLKYYFRFLIY